MSLMFTASGIRGIYGETLTPNVAYRVVVSFIAATEAKRILVGRDTRPSGLALEHAVSSAIVDLGRTAYIAGVQPTPVLLWASRVMGFNGCIAITASHNPPEWNALKLAGREGLLRDVEVVKRFFEGEVRIEAKRSGATLSFNPLPHYLDEAVKHLDVDLIRRQNIKVVVDPGGGAGFEATAMLLRRVGCEVVTINSAPGVFARPIEPTRNSLKDLAEAVKAYGADVGFAHDCDADRLVCVTEEGEVLPEDYGLAVASMHVLSKRRGPLVVNVASSMVFKWISQQLGVKLYWSPVGEAKVVELIERVKAPIGGEGSSGGIVPAFFNKARDGVFGAALIVEAIASRGERLSEIVKEIPRYHQVRGYLTCEPPKYGYVMDKLKRNLSGEAVDLTDGVKVWFKEGWGLVRPSQTEPKIRVLCEAEDRDSAHDLLNRLMRMVKEAIDEAQAGASR